VETVIGLGILIVITIVVDRLFERHARKYRDR
jgi:hypothetical protein